MSQKALHVTYLRRMAVTAVIYVISVFGIALLVNNTDLPLPITILLALLPMLPISYGLWAYNQFFNGLDELQRLIHSKAIIFAAGGTGLFTVSYGFLQSFADFPNLNLIWVFPILLVLWTFGQFFYGRKYGASDE